jgi:hypothetical protein
VVNRLLSKADCGVYTSVKKLLQFLFKMGYKTVNHVNKTVNHVNKTVNHVNKTVNHVNKTVNLAGCVFT